MCQVDEEYSEELEKRTLYCVYQKCVKCKLNTAALVIRAGDAFCRDCFKEYFVHKFRAMLGKNRLIFPGEKVLLAVSGGSASSSMLQQVQQGLSLHAAKKLRFVPGIVYIDEGGACGQSTGERQKAIGQLESIFQATGFPFYIVHLEEVFHLPGSVLEAGPAVLSGTERGYKSAVERYIHDGRVGGAGPPEESNPHTEPSPLRNGRPPPSLEHTQALQMLFAAVQTLTAREDMLQTLRQHLIVHTARVEGYSKVMMGDSCSRLAVKLLSNMTLGRGASLAMDTGFADYRYGDVVIVRPMRDYSSKEIAFYNRIFRVPSLFIPGLETKVADKASIQRLTESFVTKLQADFPSTVSTIYRTSEKLRTACTPKSVAAVPTARCLLCLCPLDTGREEASAYHATLVSERLSLKPGPGSPAFRSAAAGQRCSAVGGQEGACGTSGDGCCSTERVPASADLRSLLCYSCRLTIRDMSSMERLPPYILTEAECRRSRSQMKEEIAEFLLADEEED